MDHHCPWTNNCVSHFTLPHFIRFLFYAVGSMAYLEYFLSIRCSVLWNNRDQPSVSKIVNLSLLDAEWNKYLGPTAVQLVHLFLLTIVNSITLSLVSITFVRTIWGLGGNVTTIESWEIERHHRLLTRSRVLGGQLDGPDGIKVRIRKQEFPYDIGIWNNFKQGMGTGLVLIWAWPFARTPHSSGLEFEVNGFEEPSCSWPPPDPDRMPRLQRQFNAGEAFTFQTRTLSDYDEIQAFKKRQQEDLERRKAPGPLQRRKPFHERYGGQTQVQSDEDDIEMDSGEGSESGEEGWRDSGGNRLKDYGVDEKVEFYDEDDLPLSVLLRRRRKAQTS